MEKEIEEYTLWRYAIAFLERRLVFTKQEFRIYLRHKGASPSTIEKYFQLARECGIIVELTRIGRRKIYESKMFKGDFL